jgi:hypothetical protein
LQINPTFEVINIYQFQFLTIVLTQIVVLLVISVVFNIIKKFLNHFLNIRIRFSDLYPIILSMFIYNLSVNKHGISYLPIAWGIALISGIIYGIYIIIKNMQLNLWKFYKHFWRLSVIIMFIAWIITIIVLSFQIL